MTDYRFFLGYSREQTRTGTRPCVGARERRRYQRAAAWRRHDLEPAIGARAIHAGGDVLTLWARPEHTMAALGSALA